MLVAAQMGSALNLSVTIIVLRLFYQQPGTTIPRRLRYFAFRIIAPLTLFNVKTFVNVNQCVKITEILPADTELKPIGENSESEQDSTTEKRSKQTQTETNYNEWQVLAMICDRFYFILLFIFTAFAMVYGHTSLYVECDCCLRPLPLSTVR